MPSLASFSTKDVERLFLTYKRNQDNYRKIKDKVAGPDAEQQYKSKRKSSIFFFVALTFIIVVSSSFSLIAEHMNSFIALWMIWGGAFIIFVAWSIINYQTNYRILKQNQAFFSKFEAIAKKHDTLEDFTNNW